MSPASSADQQAVPHTEPRPGPLTGARPGAAGDGGPSGPASPAVYAVELRKEFRRTVALAGLSMTVGRGEVFGFLGPNGAGKTTAVKLLLGLSRPTSGEAMVLGAPAGDRETRRKVGYLPELFRFQAWLTAREVLVLHGRLLGLARARQRAAADDALDTVGLAGRGDDKVGTFSKGMQQRLGLGVALLGEPALVILDEPTSALDPVGRHQVRAVIRGLHERGATVFLNTHLLEEAEHVCDRVTVISQGRCLATGTLSELRGRQSSVRLRVTGLPDRWWQTLTTGGRWSAEGEWVRGQDLPPGQVPDLVAAVVARGGRVEAVVPEQATLEASFLKLLGES
ncbi:MAG TPA: ABC transporter ATP-binding protein [Streptosporangiaceae bacterium]|nr:ABC transporter ATP-binding protein [Streptosporangiaceae bacterium]